MSTMTETNADYTRLVASSEKDDWATAQSFVDEVAERLGFNFVLDAAAEAWNSKCDGAYISPIDDALTADWSDHVQGPGDVWLNPPYSRAAGVWLHKAALEASEMACRVVVLVFVRSDVAWWHDCVMRSASRVWFVRGRVRFLDALGVPARCGAPAPTCLVEFDGRMPPPEDGPTFRVYTPSASAEPRHPWVCGRRTAGLKCNPPFDSAHAGHYPQCQKYAPPRRGSGQATQ